MYWQRRQAQSMAIKINRKKPKRELATAIAALIRDVRTLAQRVQVLEAAAQEGKSDEPND